MDNFTNKGPIISWNISEQLAPAKYVTQYEQLYEQGSEKQPETSPNNFKPFSCCLKISHQHFSKNIAPPKIATKQIFLSPRRSEGVAT